MSDKTKLRIAGVIKESVVDGPGLRYVIFTQGCPHHCPGCHNPETHDFNGGYEVTLDELYRSIISTKLITGVTFSGGEPFIQAGACAELARKLRENQERNFNLLSFTGYYLEKLQLMIPQRPEVGEFLKELDAIVDGPFEQQNFNVDLRFRGSNNQHFYYLRNGKIVSEE